MIVMADEWAALDAGAAADAARAIAAGLPKVEFDGVEDGPVVDGRVWQRAYFMCDGRRYALVPGGRVRLGFDVAAFVPTAEQLASYARSVADFGMPDELRGYFDDMQEYAAATLSPPRDAVVPTLLVAVEAVEPDDLLDWDGDGTADESPAALLAEFGARLASPDEWEYACGAGATTLFRWGDTYADTNEPYTSADGPHRAANRFGLVIAHDPYASELTSDPAVLVGGDGGVATCGRYGAFLAWLPLASAYRLMPPDEMRDDFLAEARVRPVIDVMRTAVATAFERLAADPDAWADYEREAAEWDGAAGDGLDDDRQVRRAGSRGPQPAP